jgi:acyl-CoA thioester hydrolase
MPPPPDRTPFSLALTARPEDIDELGHVNNTVYLRWVQEAAVAHWQAVAPADAIAGLVWVVTRHEIDYRRPTLVGETLVATTWVGSPKGARFDRFVEITGSDGTLRCAAHTDWALLDADSRRLLRVTPELAALFAR